MFSLTNHKKIGISHNFLCRNILIEANECKTKISKNEFVSLLHFFSCNPLLLLHYSNVSQDCISSFLTLHFTDTQAHHVQEILK